MNKDNDYLTDTTEKIGKLNYQKMLIFNEIKKIDQELLELDVKINPLKDRINLRRKKKLLEKRKFELQKFNFFEKIVNNLNLELKNTENKKK